MLTPIVAHADLPVQPHDAWSAWTVDPLVLAGIGLVGVWFARGRRTGVAGARRRAWCLGAVLLAIAVALLSPLDAAAGSLASAHMVQHVVLVLVVAPLLALGAPGAAIVRGAPSIARRALIRWRRHVESLKTASRVFGSPVATWLLHVGTLWFWHAAVPYDIAVENDVVHVVEHATLTLTAFAFWRAVLPPIGTFRAPSGIGILLVFAMGLQSVFLSALLTFAPTPWYSAYEEATAAWGLTPLEDQQAAGAIMWVPAGLVYVGAGLALLVAWIRSAERPPLDSRDRSVVRVEARRSGATAALRRPD